MGLDANFVRMLDNPDPEDTETVLVEEVAYFRKVNFLHLWVQKHLNGGEEHNCEYIPMHLEAVSGLAQTCHRVLAHPELGPELLPTTSGFFFGRTEYDEHYLADVQEVLDALHTILLYEKEEASPPGSGRYAYWSWW